MFSYAGILDETTEPFIRLGILTGRTIEDLDKSEDMEVEVAVAGYRPRPEESSQNRVA